MCANVETIAANLMQTEEPTLNAVLAASNVPAATIANIDVGYEAAEAAVRAFTPGSTTTTIIQLLNASLSIVVAEKDVIPVNFLALYTVVVAGLDGALGLFEVEAKTTPEEKAAHAEVVEQRIQSYAPSFKITSIDHARAFLRDSQVAASKYKRMWDAAVPDGDEYVHLKYANLVKAAA